MANAPARKKPTSNAPRRAGPAWFVWLGIVLTLLGVAAVLHRGADPAYVNANTSHKSSALAGLSGGGSIKVSGIDSLALKVADSGGVRSVEWSGTVYRDGAQIGTVGVRDKDDGFVLTDRSGTSFRFKAKDDSGYSIRDEAGAVLYRVKIKEDKFNVYDGAGNRLLYGKEKKGELRLRNDAGGEIGRIEGTVDLAFAAILAVPIAPEVRIAALAHRVEKLIP